jgi:hypothetical protein
MAQTKINFSDTINSSLQVGDIAYASEVLPNGITKAPNLIGIIIEVKLGYIIVEHAGSATVTQGMFMLFSKPTEANDSSLKGYFADVTFKNYSSEYAELYSIGSEVTASSK